MTGCNCGPMPDYMATYIENVNSLINMNKEMVVAYLAWYNMFLPYWNFKVYTDKQ